jgi:hypothetical protein
MGRSYITRRDSLISLFIDCAKLSPRSSLLAPKPAIQMIDADRKRTILITDKCTRSFTILSALQGAQDVHSAMPSLCHTSGEHLAFLSRTVQTTGSGPSQIGPPKTSSVQPALGLG